MGKPNVNVIIGTYQKAESTYKKIILKGGMPFAPQLIDDKCIYVVKYNFDLGGEEVTIPADSIIDFDGGSIKNGKLVLDNTMLDGIIIIGKDLDVSGTCSNQTAYQSWFEDNDIDAWHKFINDVDGPTDYEYESGVYETNVTVNKEIDHNIIVNGNGADVSFPYKYYSQAFYIHPKQYPDTNNKIYLAQAAYMGDKSVVVSAADFDKFSVGDTIMIRDLANSSFHWTRDYREGEFAYIRSKDHTTHELLIDHQLLGTYKNNIDKSGDNRTCFVVKWDKIDATISDLTIRMDETRGDYYGDYGVIDVMKGLGTTTETVITEGSTVNPIVLTTGASVEAVNGDFVTYRINSKESYRFIFDGTHWHQYQYVYMVGLWVTHASVRLDNVKVLNFTIGIDVQFIYGGVLDNCTSISTIKTLDDSNGLSIISCQNLIINGGTYQARNHGVTITCNYASIFTIISRNISITNVNGIGTASALNQDAKNGIEIHAGEYIKIDHCYAMGILAQLGGHLIITNNHLFNDITVFPKDFDINIVNNTLQKGTIEVTMNDGSYNAYADTTTENWNPIRLEDNITERMIIQGNSLLNNKYIDIKLYVSGDFYPNLERVTILVKDNNASCISAVAGGTGVTTNISNWDEQLIEKYEGSASIHLIGNTFRDYPGRVFCKELVYEDNSICGLMSAGAPNLYKLNCLNAVFQNNKFKAAFFYVRSMKSVDFQRNIIDSITRALFFTAFDRFNIASNTITNCANGIRLFGTAEIIVVEDNYINGGKSVLINSANDYTRDTPFSIYVRSNNFVNCGTNNMVFNFLPIDAPAEYNPVATIYADNNKFKSCGVNTINCTNHLHLYTYKNCDENNSTKVYVGGLNRIDLDDVISDTYESIIQTTQGNNAPNIIYDIELTPAISDYNAMYLSFFINGIGRAKDIENVDLSVRFLKYNTDTPYCGVSVLQINNRGYVDSTVKWRVDYHISYNTTTNNYHLKFRLYTDATAESGRMQCYMKLVPFDTWNGDKLVKSVVSEVVAVNRLTPSKFNITGSDVIEDGTVYKAAQTLPVTKGSTNVVAISKADLPNVAVKADTFYLNETKSFVYYDGSRWLDGDGAAAGIRRRGIYSARPSGTDIYVGFIYFATDLNKVIIWDGSNWRNTDGSALTGALPTEGHMYVVNDASVFDPATVPFGYAYWAQNLGTNFYFGKPINESLLATIDPSGGRVLNKTNNLTENKRYAIRATRNGIIIKFFKESTGEYDTFIEQDDALNKYATFTAPDPTVYTSIRIEYAGTNQSICYIYLSEIDLRWFEEDGVVGVYKKNNVNKQTLRRGTWANKPNGTDSALYVGFRYFCTDKQTAEGATNGIEIIYKGQDTTDPANPVDIWVDALGRVVE